MVSGGCVFFTNQGGVEARSLEDGSLVWRSTAVNPPLPAAAYAVTVVDGRVFVNWGAGGFAYTAALDVHDGALLWQGGGINFGYQTNQLSSAVVGSGIDALFTTGPDFDPKARPGYALFDAATGTLLHEQTTIPETDLAAGYAGGGVWGTPTYDPVDRYLYAATANPDSPDREHELDNAILKIDLDPSRTATFGTIVAHVKGTPDTITGYDNAACQATVPLIPNHFGGEQNCGQTDVDFGNGPTLWRHDTGTLHLAILQKSGVLHVLDADTMQVEWEKEVGTNAFFSGTNGNLGRAATDGETLWLYTNPGVVKALDAKTGADKWQWPLPEMHGGSAGNIALANGVVYLTTFDNTWAWDAANGGPPLWFAYVGPQNPEPDVGSLGSATVVAGNRVVANLAGSVTVYELPGQ
jgi:outer membrane protein assembly factor BamB